MTRVVSISGHPYGGTHRAKGDVYDVSDADLDLMISLKRVRKLTEEEARKHEQTYKTRDLTAERGVIMGTRGNITPEQRRQELQSGVPAQPGAPTAPTSESSAAEAARQRAPRTTRPTEQK